MLPRFRERRVRRAAYLIQSVSGEVSILPSFEEDIGFIDKKHCVPGLRKIKLLYKLAFYERLDCADISHCESKEWPV